MGAFRITVLHRWVLGEQATYAKKGAPLIGLAGMGFDGRRGGSRGKHINQQGKSWVSAAPAAEMATQGRPPMCDVRKWCCLRYFGHAVSPRFNFYNAFGNRCRRDPIFAIHYKHGPRPGEHFKHAVSPRPNSSDTFGRRCHRDPIFAIHHNHGPQPGGY